MEQAAELRSQARELDGQPAAFASPTYLLLKTPRPDPCPVGLYQMPWGCFAAMLGIQAGRLASSPGVFQRRVRTMQEAEQWWCAEGHRVPVPMIVGP